MILRKRAEEILTLVDRAQEEIVHGDGEVEGEVSIGAGETDTVRLFARAAGRLRRQHPGIRLRISSGNADFVLEQLDKGLIDFGLLFSEVDDHKYQSMAIPLQDTWGVLMRKDAPLAEKETISPQDLWDKPLILSHQRGGGVLQWLGREPSQLSIVATYNLVYNASLLVDEGLGYALCFDKLINTQGSSLTFRPLAPPMLAEATVVWKKYQVFSKAARLFLEDLGKSLQ